MTDSRFQWSASNPIGEIVVVRSDDFNELKVDVSAVRVWFSGKSGSPVSKPALETTTEAQVCKEHNVPMKKNINGKWYHREFEAGQGVRFCNGFQWSDWTK